MGVESDRQTQSLGLSNRFPITDGIVRVLDGEDQGISRALHKGDKIVVGNQEGCDLRLEDPGVSRRHCEIELGPFGFFVRDLESHNGTLFEGARVREIAVALGAIIQVGSTHVALGALHESEKLAPSARSEFGGLVGQSLMMRRAFAVLERAAQTDITVLLGGETGTGKEVAARALHDEGPRKHGPFEVFDCGAVASGLLASDLFGHVQGAFTGADRDRAGVFERGHGGTVFLDEIAELPLALQPALLRVCAEGKVVRVGSGQPIEVDVRIVAATRKDLAKQVLNKQFREDLYYRLAVLPINLPPLRSRKSDLPFLCERLLRGLGVENPGPIGGPNLAVLSGQDWFGNVRELRNTLELALAFATKPVSFGDLRFELAATTAPTGPQASFQAQKSEAIASFERDFLENLLKEHENNIMRASRTSGIERTQLKRLLRKHGLLPRNEK